MTNQKGKICFLALAIILFLAGCGNVTDTPTPAAPEPVALSYESKIVSFTEPQGEVFDSLGWTAEHNGVTYSFASNIEEEDRNAVVNETLAILNLIESKVGAVPDGCTICVRPDNYLPRVMDHTLYIGFENFRTQEYAIGIVQMVFGNEMPYGLEYALGVDVAQAMGYGVETIDVSLTEALMLCDTDPIYLDLNYACFLEAYADQETLPKVKALALEFYHYLLQNGKADLYTGYTPEKYRLCLNAFLAANGKGSYDNSDLDGTMFYNGGTKIRLVWENSDGIFYVMEGYTVTYQIYGYDAVNSGYADLRKLVVDYIAQAAYMREKLQDFASVPDPVPVVFTLDNSLAYRCSACYRYKLNEIWMYATEVFGHEYGHYLLRGCESGWFQECICYWYSQYPVSEQIAPAWYMEMTNSLSLDPDDPEDAEDYLILRATEAHLGHEIDWYSMDDYVYQLGAYLVKKGHSLDTLTDPNKGMGLKVVFFHYLAGLQGEADALKATALNAPFETYGKTWAGLISDWKAYMAEEFAWTENIALE